MKRKLLSSLILFHLLVIGYSQTWQDLDSLIMHNIEIANYDSANMYAELALKSVEGQFSNDDTLYANMLARHSLIQYFLGNYEAAIEKLLWEKEIREKKQNKFHSEYARLLNDLGMMYEVIGKYDEAEHYYKSCLSIVRETLGEKHSDYAILCSNIAIFYQVTGAFNKAEHFYHVALTIQKETLGDQHPDYATTLNNLGVFCSDNGDYRQAEQYLNEALAIRNKIYGEEHTEYTQSLNNLAYLHIKLGNYNDAEKLFLHIIEIESKIYGSTHPDITIRMSNLSGIYKKKGDYTKAIWYLKEALKLDEKNFGEMHRSYALDLNNLGSIYYKLGELERAEQLFRESLQITEKIFNKDHPDCFMVLFNLSNIYLKKGEYEKSKTIAKEVLKNREEILGKEHTDYLKSLIQLATIYFETGNYEEAEPLVLKCMDQTSLNIYQNFSFLSDEEKELYLKTVSNRFNFFNSFAIERKQYNPSITINIFNNILKNKALLLRSSAIMRQSILNSNDSILLEKYQEFIDIRKQLSILYTMPKQEQYMNTEELENQANLLEKDLVRESLLFDDYKKIQNYTWESIRDKLKNKEAAIDIIRFKYSSKEKIDSVLYAALIITRESLKYPKLIVLKSSHDLEGKYYSQYNNYILEESFIEGLPQSDLAKSCYEAFWKDIEEEIGDIERVYLCPDGIFHKINLNTILSPDEKYICETKELILLNSLSEILEIRKLERNNDGSILLAGNPDFSFTRNSNQQLAENQTEQLTIGTSIHGIFRDVKGQKLSSLPGSQIEVEQINSLLKQNNWETECLIGNTALEDAIKIKIKHNPQVLHLATHGFFARDIISNNLSDTCNSLLFGQNKEKAARFPLLRSGLMFCGSQNTLDGNFNPSGNGEDGILTGYEVMNLDLRSTELVVLSACETGLGEVMNGEGVYGLQRAFKIAGVQNIIMSLWKVNDEATQLLMRKFYEYWMDGNSKREAFTLAQDYLRTKSEFKRPYFWGGFVFIGLESPVNKFPIIYLWLLTLFLPVGIFLWYKRKIKKKLK